MKRVATRLSALALTAAAAGFTLAVPAQAATEAPKAAESAVSPMGLNGPYTHSECQRRAADARRQGIGQVSDCFPHGGGWSFYWTV